MNKGAGEGGALTGPQAHGHLLGSHLNDIRARRTGALGAEGQAPQNLRAANWALQLASTATAHQVCFQVTSGHHCPWAAEVLGMETGRAREVKSRTSGKPRTEPIPSTVHLLV